MSHETRPIGAEPSPGALTPSGLYMMAFAGAIVVANAYYIHPIIALVARDFGISDAMIGAAPAFNQIALAIGVFLLLPLGDRFGNRNLALVFVAGQTVGLFIMVLAKGFTLFVAGSTLLGFFTITPYLLPAYASKRVSGDRLGYVTAILTVGIILGILVARAGAGVLGEYFGWRIVYWIAIALMVGVCIVLAMIMEPRRAQAGEKSANSYLGLLASTLMLARKYPDVLLSGSIQALNFGVFLSVWMGLGLHLTSESMGHGADAVGYLAAISIVSLLTTPRLGRWADRIGARQARVRLAAVNLLGCLSLFFLGGSLWLLLIPVAIQNIAGPAMDVSGRMTFLDQDPDIRTRLMTIYITLMFGGAGLASWGGTLAYDLAGWSGNAMLAVVLSAGVLTLSVLGASKTGRNAQASV